MSDQGSRSSEYYDEGDPVPNEECRDLLATYSNIPVGDQISHIKGIRDRAWDCFNYPCIGAYHFVEFGISELPQYTQVLQRLKNGDQLLDLACCLGQDIRKLIHDGAPPENITGIELVPEFVNLGFDLFKDRETLKSNIIIGNFLKLDELDPSLLKPGSISIVYAGSFFHLFDWHGQIDAMCRTLRLLDLKGGSMVLGRQGGLDRGEELEHPSAIKNGKTFLHDLDSFRRMVEEVANRTGTKLDLQMQREEDAKWRRTRQVYKILFCITLQA